MSGDTDDVKRVETVTGPISIGCVFNAVIIRIECKDEAEAQRMVEVIRVDFLDGRKITLGPKP